MPFSSSAKLFIVLVAAVATSVQAYDAVGLGSADHRSLNDGEVSTSEPPTEDPFSGPDWDEMGESVSKDAVDMANDAVKYVQGAVSSVFDLVPGGLLSKGDGDEDDNADATTEEIVLSKDAYDQMVNMATDAVSYAEDALKTINNSLAGLLSKGDGDEDNAAEADNLSKGAFGIAQNAVNTATNFLTGITGGILRKEDEDEYILFKVYGDESLSKGDGDDCDSIIDAICGMKDSETMCDIMKNITVDGGSTEDAFGPILKDDKNYTIFVPSDSAFASAEGALSETDDEELGRILLFHFYEDVMLTYDELACSEKLSSMTEKSDESRTKCEKVRINEKLKYQSGGGNTKHAKPAKIGTKDVMACNAAIHSVDHLMLPVYLKQFEDGPERRGALRRLV